MKRQTRLRWAVLLLGCMLAAQQQVHAQSQAEDDDRGAYLSATFGNGIIHIDALGEGRWMHWRTLEIRAGRSENKVFGGGRIDFVHYNEGHPDNNHRDGFSLQWLALRRLGGSLTGEFGIGPYLSMNTTEVDGRQIDDKHLGLLLSAGLRMPLAFLPDGTHLRLGLNHAYMPNAHRSTALLFGIGRQFGPARPDPETEPAADPWWIGGSVGNSITNMAGRSGATAGTLEARKVLGERLEHWALSGKFVFEGDDKVKVDRRGVAAQLWYVQQVTPRFAMSAGLGPYLTHNRRDEVDPDSGNLLISLQAEHALSRHTRVFVNFNRVKTFRETDDRDLFQLGLLLRF
jgi:hypothetical protein